MKYKLTKTFKKNGVNGKFITDGKLITNKQFILPVDLVKQRDEWMFDAIECVNSRTKDIYESHKDHIRFEKTEYLFSNEFDEKYIGRIFKSECGLHVGIDEKFVIAFDLDYVTGEDQKSPLMSHDGVMLMGMRLPELFQTKGDNKMKNKQLIEEVCDLLDYVDEIGAVIDPPIYKMIYQSLGRLTIAEEGAINTLKYFVENSDKVIL